MAKIRMTRLMFEEYAHAKKFADTYTTADDIYDYWVTPVIVDGYNYALAAKGSIAGISKIEDEYIKFMQQGRGKACIM